MAMRRPRIVIFCMLGILFIGLAVWFSFHFFHRSNSFNGPRAYQDVLAQMDFGPRTVGSQAHAKTIAYIQEELRKAKWDSLIQKTSWQGFPVENIIATRPGQTGQVVIAAHYDSRSLADQDTTPPPFPPVPGANDGASGVAVLLELARTLPANSIPVTLVFFDAEDDGGIAGQDWLMGSRAYVASLSSHPKAAIILDMIGDANLNIYIERNSDPTLVKQIWDQAAELDHQNQFIPVAKYDMIDDHTPFLEAGIPAVDIIDFDYPYWHTSQDTADKVSPQSLQTVGDVVRAWILTQK